MTKDKKRVILYPAPEVINVKNDYLKDFIEPISEIFDNLGRSLSQLHAHTVILVMHVQSLEKMIQDKETKNA